MSTSAGSFIFGRSKGCSCPVCGALSPETDRSPTSMTTPGISPGVGKMDCLVSDAGITPKCCVKKPLSSPWNMPPISMPFPKIMARQKKTTLTLYEQGLLTQEARQVYEALLQEGPLNTVALRKAARLTSRESDGRFNKAITDLQADFKVMPVGVARAGAWNYAFIYEITARHHPELLDQAQQIGENLARQLLTELYIRSLGAATQKDLGRLFGWRPLQTQHSITAVGPGRKSRGGSRD